MKTIKELEATYHEDNKCNSIYERGLIARGKVEALKDVVKLIDEDISVTKKLDDDIEWKFNVLIVLDALKERIEG